jgi:hypothetical protein
MRRRIQPFEPRQQNFDQTMKTAVRTFNVWLLVTAILCIGSAAAMIYMMIAAAQWLMANQ